jgi:hypothetical protein
MLDNQFYAVENDHNIRQIRILSVGSLVSKQPAKEKRISIKVRMPLSGTINMGAPEQIDHAYLFVAQNHQKVTLDKEFDGYCIEFSVENLFGEPVVGNDCAMKSFEIFEMGKEESPDVVMTFTVRMSFSKSKWDWLGQFVGEDVWAKFTPGEAGTAKVEEEDGTLLDDGENEDGPDGDEDSEEGEYDPDSGEVIEMPLEKSGPSVLKAFHEKTIENEQKRGRGRPKKDAVDPLTVESPMAF